MQRLRMLEAVVSNARDVVLVTEAEPIDSADGGPRIVYANPAFHAMTGYLPDEVIGKTPRILQGPRTDRAALDEIRAALSTWRPVTVEVVNYRKDGSDFDVELSIFPITDDAGHFTHWVSVQRDVTDRNREHRTREVLAELLHGQKLESMALMAGGIAHDFNNLLVGILGNASVAKSELAAESPVAPLMGEIEIAARRGAQLTASLLTFAGRDRSEAAPVDLNALVVDTDSGLRAAVSRSTTVDYDLAPGLPPVHGEPARLRQVLLTLATNGSEAMECGRGKLRVVTRLTDASIACAVYDRMIEQPPDGPCVELTVEDNGSGMGNATLAKAFDPFFSTKFVGRGLGLSALQGIVRSHRGAVCVRTVPGRGTSVSVYFPLASGPARAGSDSGSSATATTDKGAGEPLVLVVEDESVVLRFVVRLLKSARYRVASASSGAEAMEILSGPGARKIAVALLDLTMPGVDGSDLLNHLAETLPGVPVIVFSGFDHGRVMDRLHGLRPFGFLQKPFAPEDLLAMIAAAVESGAPAGPSAGADGPAPR